MGTIVILNHIKDEVLFIGVADEDIDVINDEYGNDVDSWMADKGLDKKFGFNMDNISYMCVTDSDDLEMFRCDIKSGQMMNVFPVL